MTDNTDTVTTILPASSSAWEQRLDQAVGGRLAEINIPTETLWDPWNCPDWWLPYLAYAVAVSVWRETWPEETKRQVIAGSMETHAMAGTRPALKKALADVAHDAQIIEWFETDPPQPRGTFEVLVFSETVDRDNPGADLQDYVVETIERAKSYRSHFTFKAGALYPAGMTFQSDVYPVIWLRETFGDE